MEISIESLTENEFGLLDVPALFHNPKSDRAFAVISNGKHRYKFGWQSTGIKPRLMVIEDSYCAIGIDRRFLVFSFETGKIVRSMRLNCFFYEMKIHNSHLYVIAELQIFKIAIPSFKVINTYEFQEFVGTVTFENGQGMVRCLDGSVHDIQ